MSANPAKVKNGTSKQAASDRRKRFASAYVANGGNATRAHMQVYGSIEVTAASEGCKLTREPKTKAMIDNLRNEINQRYALTPERIYREVARIAYFDPAKMFDAEGKPLPIQDIDEDTRAAISALEIDVNEGRVTYRARQHDKNAALDKALKLVRAYDAPPPTVDDSGNQMRDPREMAKWVAFYLARGSNNQLEHKPQSE